MCESIVEINFKEDEQVLANYNYADPPEPRFLCDFCALRFKTSAALIRHQRNIHGKVTVKHRYKQSGQVHVCKMCGYKTMEKYNIIRHERIHTGDRPFECDLCDLSFTSSDKLSRHSVKHSGIKPFSCNICDKRFCNNDELRVHSKIHDPLRPKLDCPFCETQFTRMNDMKKHAAKKHLS